MTIKWRNHGSHAMIIEYDASLATKQTSAKLKAQDILKYILPVQFMPMAPASLKHEPDTHHVLGALHHRNSSTLANL